MANNHFSCWTYGEIQGNPPYGSPNGTFSATIIDYAPSKAGIQSFPSTGTVIYELSPAVTVGGASCNAVVEVLPTGLNQLGKKYATDSTVATLNTAAT